MKLNVSVLVMAQIAVLIRIIQFNGTGECQWSDCCHLST